MKRNFFKFLSLLLALTFVFTACSTPAKKEAPAQKNDKTTAESQPSTTKESGPKKIATEVIKASNPAKLPQLAKDRKDTLIVGMTAPEGKFNPIYTSSTYESWVTSLVFAPLVSNDAEGNPVPAVAEKWTVSPDQKTYTFTLKKGVKFSNGDELTAEDVAFTYTAICDPKYDGSRMDAVEKLEGYEEYKKGDAKEVKGIKVVDPYTVSFTLTEVKAPALIDSFIYGIMSKKYYGFEKGNIQKLKDLFLKPMGSGPYIFKEFKPGQEISFEKNPKYYEGEPKIKNIIMKTTTAQTNIQELTTGGVDIDRIAANPQNVQMLQDAGFLNLQLYTANQYGYMGFNLKDEKFKDKKVRQALTYGLDRAGFVKTYYKGYAEVCNSPISPVSWAYTEDVNKYEYSPEKANKLLDEAGWVKKEDGFRYKDGKKFTIHWMTYTGSKYVDTLIPIVKDNWAKIGVEVIPELVEFSTLTAKVRKMEFEFFNMAWSLSIDPDPSGIFSKSQAVVGGFNSGSWINDESEKLIEEGLKTTDLAKRKEIYGKWAKIVSDDAPYIFLNISKDMYGVSSRVKGIDLSSYIDWTYNIHKAEIVQ